MKTEISYSVWLYDRKVGNLNRKGDFTWFRFTDEYIEDPDRAVLGLTFEEDLSAQHANALRLPPWFSNLLPEGQLREWIAQDRRVKVDREVELLAQVGKDLPGAVRILPEGQLLDDVPVPTSTTASPESGSDGGKWRFSLAGVGLKFSMIRQGDRLTLPAYGQGGDWIVKLPDPGFPDVPLNEFTMMTLAEAAGIEVPERILIKSSHIENLPAGAWNSDEEYAYAVKRFDRGDNRELIHIEDFAQVLNIWPYGDAKYQGNFETVGALCYRGHDEGALIEFVRRLTFNILISNGDAHLKNWSLIYRDRRSPTLSPVYDLVSTEFYRVGGGEEDLGLKFHKTRRFSRITLVSFARLERKVNAQGLDLAQYVEETVQKVKKAWPEVAKLLDSNPELRDAVDRSIERNSKTLLIGRFD